MFYLDQPGIDYLTCTTFNPVVFATVRKVVTETARHYDRDRRRLQYTGILGHHEQGSAYCGSGIQKNRDHYLVQISGLWADTLFPLVANHVATGKARCTRIDLQLTVNYDRDSWSQPDLADTLRHDNPRRSVSYLESASGPANSKLGTVYFGSRSSDRFVRVYEKMGLGEDVFLRFEAEFKSPRADVVCKAVDEHGPWAVLGAEILRVDNADLMRMFDHDPNAVLVEPQLIRPEPATLKWLRETVAPSLDRAINDHNIDTAEVEHLFRRILGCPDPD